METLVLSHAYEPIDLWSFGQTMKRLVREGGRLFLEGVEVVAEYTRVVQGAGWTFTLPAVVRLLAPVPHKRAIRYSWQNIYARDKGRCQYCGQKVALAEATRDHVIPRALGGKTSWTNIVTACAPCNQKKGGRTPAHARMRLRQAPVKPRSLPRRRVPLPSQVPEVWKGWVW